MIGRPYDGIVLGLISEPAVLPVDVQYVQHGNVQFQRRIEEAQSALVAAHYLIDGSLIDPALGLLFLSIRVLVPESALAFGAFAGSPALLRRPYVGAPLAHEHVCAGVP